jgi:hypothetical protein
MAVQSRAPVNPQVNPDYVLDSSETHLCMRERHKRNPTLYPLSYDQLWQTILDDPIFNQTKLKDAIDIIDDHPSYNNSKQKFLALSSLLIRADASKDGGKNASIIIKESGLYRTNIDDQINITSADLLEVCSRIKSKTGPLVVRDRIVKIASSIDKDTKLLKKILNTPFGVVVRKIMHDAGLGPLVALQSVTHKLLGSIGKYFDPSSRSEFDMFIPYDSSLGVGGNRKSMGITQEGIETVTGKINFNPSFNIPNELSLLICTPVNPRGNERFDYTYNIFGTTLTNTDTSRDRDSNFDTYKWKGNAENEKFFKSSGSIVKKCISLYGKGWGDKGQNQCGILQVLIDISKEGNINGGITTLMTHDGPLLLTNYLFGSVLPLMYTSHDHEMINGNRTHVDIVALFSLTNSSIENTEEQLRLQMNETKEEWISVLKTLYRLAMSANHTTIYTRGKNKNIKPEFWKALYADMRTIFAYITILLNTIPCCRKDESFKNLHKLSKPKTVVSVALDLQKKKKLVRDHPPTVTEDSIDFETKIDKINKLNKLIETLRKCTPTRIISTIRSTSTYKMPDTLPRYIECKNTEIIELFYYVCLYLGDTNIMVLFGEGSSIHRIISEVDRPSLAVAGGGGGVVAGGGGVVAGGGGVATTEDYESVDLAYETIKKSYTNIHSCIGNVNINNYFNNAIKLIQYEVKNNNDSKDTGKISQEIMNELLQPNLNNVLRLIGITIMCVSKFHLLIQGVISTAAAAPGAAAAWATAVAAAVRGITIPDITYAVNKPFSEIIVKYDTGFVSQHVPGHGGGSRRQRGGMFPAAGPAAGGGGSGLGTDTKKNFMNLGPNPNPKLNPTSTTSKPVPVKFDITPLLLPDEGDISTQALEQEVNGYFHSKDTSIKRVLNENFDNSCTIVVVDDIIFYRFLNINKIFLLELHNTLFGFIA